MSESDFYEEYKRARDLAWKILAEYKVGALPVDIGRLCRALQISIYTYKKDRALIDTLKLTEFTKNDGFCTNINGHFVMFLNTEVTPRGRLHFTAAHEIGHIVLGHLDSNNEACQKGKSVWNRGEDKSPNPLETQANIFASRLLSPACVLYEIGVQTVSELMEITGLSYSAAKIRLGRINELRARGKFYTSPIEKQVLREFEAFIAMFKCGNT